MLLMIALPNNFPIKKAGEERFLVQSACFIVYFVHITVHFFVNIPS